MAKEVAITKNDVKVINTKNTEKKIVRLAAFKLEDSLIISLNEARRVMGVEARTLTDDELTTEIWQLMEIATDLLKSYPPLTGKQL